MRAIPAIDQGTTNSKAVLVSETGEVLATRLGRRRHLPIRSRAGPSKILAGSLPPLAEAIAACLKNASGATVEAVAVFNQRESVTVWDAETGEVLGRAELAVPPHRAGLRAPDRRRASGPRAALTGQPSTRCFPDRKFRWLLDRVPPAAACGLGTIDSWPIHCLTGGRRHVCDASNAARSQLFDLNGQVWSEELGQIFGVDITLLPEVLDSSADFGTTRGLPGIADGTPIRSAIGDSHAALFGHGAPSSPATAK